ncbi:MAG: cytidylate kinase-like family protein [Bryobacterales bacterium]|nr:cytidylate kinase-like family protein [Bryobacterales bacterium]MBV9398521.1 cytidylate kinase-like family protein [Bryobacterales bacterium]
MINVLTIDREYGSGANVIAEKVAQRLGWKLWDQALTTEIARSLECEKTLVQEREERPDPLSYRLMKSFLRGSFEGSLSTPRLKLADAEGIRAITEQLVMNAAREGNCVIVGRGSAYYLHDSPDALNVFIYAPFEEKVRRLQAAGYSEKEAIELAETVDVERADFIKQNFGVEWPPRPYFHLMVNSAMGDDCVVQTILACLQSVQTCFVR